VGRTRGYEEQDVLQGAMHAFRRRGYAGTSIKELERVTGLKGGSIYHGYGDKAGLFAAAFARYNEHVLAGRIAEHAPPDAGLAGLRSLFVSLLHEPDGASFGCLITNSAVELGGEGQAPTGVAEGLSVLHDLFAERLRQAQETGTLPNALSVPAAAAGLLALYQGILVLVRAGWDPSTLEAFLDQAFDRLGGDRDR
jgi:AcrR family transcriptional regulator